jgi:hypothetical protein
MSTVLPGALGQTSLKFAALREKVDDGTWIGVWDLGFRVWGLAALREKVDDGTWIGVWDLIEGD